MPIKRTMRAGRSKLGLRGVLARRHLEVDDRDGLDGLAGRDALARASVTIAEDARATGLSVGMVVLTLDDAQAFVDNHGRTLVTRVLDELADRLRAELDDRDRAYLLEDGRLVALLPAADCEDAAMMAWRVARSVRSEPLAGALATISFGVSASPPGEGFDFNAVFAAADGALLKAQRSGRGRIEVASSHAAAEPELPLTVDAVAWGDGQAGGEPTLTAEPVD